MCTPPSSLYEQLGGLAVLSFIIERFYDRALADEQVKSLLAGLDVAALKRKQLAFLSRAPGAPPVDAPLEFATSTVSLTARQVNRLLEHFLAALVAAAVPRILMEQAADAFVHLAPSFVSLDTPA